MNSKTRILVRNYGLSLTLVWLLIYVIADTDALSLNLGRFFWLGGEEEPPKVPDVVEVIRWRQPICILPSKGATSCLDKLKKFQTDYERVSGEEPYKNGQSHFDRNKKDANLEIIEEFPLKQLHPSRIDTESEWSQKNTPTIDANFEENFRKSKFRSHFEERQRPSKTDEPNKSEKPSLIYVTKVLDSPISATLIAHNCVPDIGLPLCSDYQNQDLIETTTTTTQEDQWVVHSGNPFLIDERIDSSDKSVLQGIHNRVFSTPVVFEPQESDVNYEKPTIDQVPIVSTRVTIDDKYQSNFESDSSGSIDKISTIKPIILESVHEAGFTSGEFSSSSSSSSSSSNDANNDASENLPPNHKIDQTSYGNEDNSRKKPNEHSIVQAIHDLIKKPNKEPEAIAIERESELKPVLVIESTAKPGLFDWKHNKSDASTTTTVTPNTQSDNEDEVPPNHSKSDKLLAIVEKSLPIDVSNKRSILDFFHKQKSQLSLSEAKEKLPEYLSEFLTKPNEHSSRGKRNLSKLNNNFGNFSMEISCGENMPLIIERRNDKPLLVLKPVYITKEIPQSTLWETLQNSSTGMIHFHEYDLIGEPLYIY